jgi:hypothetical protein
MARRLIDLTEADLEALIERRLAAAIAELATQPAEVPALLDRQGLARALSCSTKTLDRLRGEPNFPETPLYDAPRFELPLVLAWLRARNGGQGLRVVGGSK